jgi:hypothetical protein
MQCIYNYIPAKTMSYSVHYDDTAIQCLKYIVCNVTSHDFYWNVSNFHSITSQRPESPFSVIIGVVSFKYILQTFSA